MNVYDPNATKMLIEFLERSQGDLKRDVIREIAEIRKDIFALQEKQGYHDRFLYIAYGAALVAWSAIEIGIKLLNV